MSSPIDNPSSPVSPTGQPAIAQTSAPITNLVQPLIQEMTSPPSAGASPQPSNALSNAAEQARQARAIWLELRSLINRLSTTPAPQKERLTRYFFDWILKGDPIHLDAKRRASVTIIDCIASQDRYLYLGSYDLPNLPAIIFELSFLESLELSFCVPCQIPNEIAKLSALQSLEIHSSHPVHFPAAPHLAHLQRLTLNLDNQTTLHETVCNIRSLQSLELNMPQLQTLPASIQNLHQLTHLCILTSQLESIPDEVASLQQLTTLYINRSRLSVFPEPIIRLPHLRQLSLSCNFIRHLPEALSHLTTLEELEMGANQLETLPDLIGQLTLLKTLDLSNNHLNSLPDSFSQLRNLETLELSQNEFPQLPECLLSLDAPIQVLDLSNNQITRMPGETSGLRQLVALNLSHNHLEAIEPTDILSRLEYLSLAYNRLEAIPACFLSPAQPGSPFRSLDLSHNTIRVFPDRELGLLSQLDTLNLSHTHLTYLPASIRHLENMQMLDVSGNPLDFLPTEIGQLENLCHLNISTTPISELPSALADCLYLDEVVISDSQVTQDMLDAILAAMEVNQNEEEGSITDHLRARLNIWQTLLTTPPDLSPLLTWPEEQQTIIHLWLRRLERTRDFRGQKRPIAETVCHMLSHACTEASFQDTLLAQARVNNEACQDRSAMALNELFTAYKLETLSQVSIEERSDLLDRAAKTLTLRKYLAQKIAQRQQQLDHEQPESAPHEMAESVEIFLFYEIALAQSLNLLTCIQRMAYMQIGQVTWISVHEAQAFVEQNYTEELVRLPALCSVAEACDFFRRIKDDLQAPIYKQMEELEAQELPENDLLKQASSLSVAQEACRTQALRLWLEFRPFLNWAETLANPAHKSRACERLFDCFYNKSPSLNLSGLEIEDLPEAFSKLPLKRLILAENSLEHLPECVLNLSELEELCIASNPIKVLPETLSQLSRLCILDISSTAITQLPASIASMSQLLMRVNSEAGSGSMLKQSKPSK